MDDWRSLVSLGYSTYEANPTGLVRRRATGEVLKYKPKENGYIALDLNHDDGPRDRINMDEIICKMFIGPPPNVNSKVIHINKDKLDSNVNNLRWGTKEDRILVNKYDYRTSERINGITLENEEWRDCSPYGYVDYLASSLGRIYSMKSGKILPGNLQCNGYYRVNIRLNNMKKYIATHRLICYGFHGFPPDPTYTVDHIDRNKINNIPSNLRWASKSEQAFNKDPVIKREQQIAQVRNGKIVDFHDRQSILEIFDVDEILIPDQGLSYQGDLWIYENFIDLDLVDEVWAPINAAGTIYKISNMGRVQTLQGKTFGSSSGAGYKIVTILGSHHFVHRLVILAFRGTFDNNLVVNHKDADKTNNRLDNLEVVTQSENVIHRINMGHKGLKPVRQYNLDGTFIAEYSSMRDASNATKVHHPGISQCANGKQRTAGGYIWRLV